jgi:hypothetical protein
LAALPADIVSRIARAEDHVRDFEARLTAFLASGCYKVGIKNDYGRRKRIYYASHVAPFPESLAVIAADAMSNLRAALDYVAYMAVVRGIGGDPSWVYFPIASSAQGYETACSRLKKSVGKEVADTFDAAEPYLGGKGGALWRMQELHRRDKHRGLLGAYIANGGVVISDHLRTMAGPGFADLIPDFFLRGPEGPIKEGTHLYIEPLDLEIQTDQRFTFTVSFVEPWLTGPREPALTTLHDFIDCVRKTVDGFRPFLG